MAREAEAGALTERIAAVMVSGSAMASGLVNAMTTGYTVLDEPIADLD